MTAKKRKDYEVDIFEPNPGEKEMDIRENQWDKTAKEIEDSISGAFDDQD